MEGSTDICVNMTDNLNILVELNNQDVSPAEPASYFEENTSDDDEAPVQRVKKRIQQFSDSDMEKENISSHSCEKSDSETEEPNKIISIKSGLTRSRIRLGGSSSDSDASEKCDSEQKIRLNNKRLKMKQKFHGLLNSRSKSPHKHNKSDVGSSDNSGNSNSDNETSSITKIKEKIKKSMAAMPSICDPDTSDEESTMNTKVAPKQRQKKTQKATKMIEAQPMRMSAKQAMENMQIIKSESNRMLREKAVSLPYHRPKALSLKDIMSRRKPAVSSDGKVLPIKMNEEQLKQYALQLEQRQKEMMELCKSESDEDTAEKCDEVIEPIITETESFEKSEEQVPNALETENNENCQEQVLDVAESNNFISDDKTENVNNTEKTPESVNMNNDANTEVNTVDSCSDSTIVIHLSKENSATNEDQNRNESINSNNQNDSNTDLKLVYNDDSIEEENITLNKNECITNGSKTDLNVENNSVSIEEKKIDECSEQASQSINLNYTETNTEELPTVTNHFVSEGSATSKAETKEIDSNKNNDLDFLSDDDIDMAEIDLLIENAEIMNDDKDHVDSSKSNNYSLQMKPKLMGAPGMMIDLDGTSNAMQKRSGVELLKEKFAYFSKLKTPEELERENEKRLKPGAQHLKLKHELEEKIAEQRSLEWAKRLEEERQQNQELDAILDDDDDANESIDNIKSKPNGEEHKQESDSESEEELVEDDIEIKDKPKKRNLMVDDEAEESDIDEGEQETDLQEIEPNEEDISDDGDSVQENNDDSSEDEETSESEVENDTTKIRKGRILKAFEDSDDEDTAKEQNEAEVVKDIVINKGKKTDCKDTNDAQLNCELIPPGSSEDDVIQLAQRHASVSEDLFTSQEYTGPNEDNNDANETDMEATQTFSISNAKPSDFLCSSQPYHDPNLKEIADGFTQNMLQSQQSQPIGEDLLALCTGKFYDNEFVSQNHGDESDECGTQKLNKTENNQDSEKTQDINDINLDNISQEKTHDNVTVLNNKLTDNDHTKPKVSDENNDGGKLLKSILDELDDPEFDKPKPNKFFPGDQQNNSVESSQLKKRLIIDSDDEANDTNVADRGKKKKIKKKKLQDRALQFSDDEEDEDLGVEDDYESDLEDDTEKVVDYDSEENEIVVKPNEVKKKRKATDFFEQEAELTSEDEWVGSGDEDEHGLDRMEREEGDDEVFHQGKLRKELGQIHMRDVLDQDKREVRLLQELLFEDGDLGVGHRQRKFRWKNTGDEETGTVPDEFTDTQEEEFESEEQWRKQRHEREVFLRQMQKQDDDETTLNVTVNRTTIIKANLSSKSMSTLLMEANQSKAETTNSVTVSTVAEKKNVKDVPSPKITFSILKQNYHGSLLTRGRGALARLAALATPLAVDDDGPKIASLASHKRNFVFTALTQDENPPKVSIKRKADASTPKLMKKMKIEEKQSRPKSSLLEHINL